MKRAVIGIALGAVLLTGCPNSNHQPHTQPVPTGITYDPVSVNDGGVKFKINGGVWTPPLGKVEVDD